MAMDLRGKKVLVCGMALSGVYSAILLKKLGAHVILQDIKDTEEARKEGEKIGVELLLGKNPDDIILEQDVVVLSPGLPLTLDFIQKAIDAGIYVVGEFELASKLCKCDVAAITGTNGKTTTTTLLGDIMKKFKENTVMVGNIGIPFTKEVLGLDENSYCVAEVSSFQLETIDTFKPNISAVLNITPDHLDRHKTMENYVAAKERIFANQTSEDFLILNYDNPYCVDMKNRANCRVIFFSVTCELQEGLFLRGADIWVRLDNAEFLLININELSIIGYHNVENAMAASAMALCAGVPHDIIRTALKEFQAVPHRMEYVRTVNDIIFYNDSKATNPGAAIKSIESMTRPTILIGGGYNKDTSFDEWVKSFGRIVKYLILIGSAKDEILRVCEKYDFTDILVADTFDCALELAYKNATSGDCVLLSPACASWDMFTSYEERGNIFKDYVSKLGGE